jgi:uridine kinase
MSVFAQTKKFLAGIEALNSLNNELFKEVLERLVKGQSLHDTKKIETTEEGEEQQKEQKLPPEAIIVGMLISKSRPPSSYSSLSLFLSLNSISLREKNC